MKRANNFLIVLSRIKLSYPVLRECLATAQDAGLSLENLQALATALPTSGDIDVVRAASQRGRPLGRADEYVLEMMKVPVRRELFFRGFLSLAPPPPLAAAGP